MNRNNIWIHVSLAVVLITIAAILGQLNRWRSALNVSDGITVGNSAHKCPGKKAAASSVPEVLVRFKPGVSLAEIRGIAAAHNDRLMDEIESVGGLSVIDDRDDADA
ncbi:MAG: hypothetical protein ABIV21_01505, partial [Pyrinomonadaceae bacterium]